MITHHQIVIVGGGTGGITVAARLLKDNDKLDVAIIEPSDKHYYQPLWTLVGGGIFKPEDSERREADVIPYGANWIQDFVATFTPEQQSLTTREIAGNVTYASRGIGEVNKIVSESTRASQSITVDIAEVNQAADEFSNSITRITGNAEELAQLAELLQDMVRKFRY